MNFHDIPTFDLTGFLVPWRKVAVPVRPLDLRWARATMPGSISSEPCRASPCSLVKVFQQGPPGGERGCWWLDMSGYVSMHANTYVSICFIDRLTYTYKIRTTQYIYIYIYICIYLLILYVFICWPSTYQHYQVSTLLSGAFEQE